MAQKIKIDIPIILPEIPDEKDSCVDRLISIVDKREGIEHVHVDQHSDGNKLCVHFDPDIISLAQVQNLARITGAEITQKFRHVIFNLTGIRHQRHARLLSENFSQIRGVMAATVAASGTARLEYDSETINEQELKQEIVKHGLSFAQENIKADKEADKDHEHKHGGLWGENTELIFAIISGVLLGGGYLIAKFLNIPSSVALAMYVLAYFFGGFFTAKEAVETILQKKFEIDFLMLLAAAGAAILGEWAEGALLLFLFSLGHGLENYAMNRAKKSIESLSKLGAKTAIVRRGTEEKEVSVEELIPGDIVIVKPNTKLPADGVIIKGTSSVNQAPITGESVPVDKFPMENVKLEEIKDRKIPAENSVFAGTINGSGAIEVLVTKKTQDTTLSRLLTLVREAETQKSPTQQFTDKFERFFVPAVLLLVVCLLFSSFVIDETFAQSFYRAMAVLVAASPCALAISTPSAVLSGIARAAKGGVLIKGGRPLENLGELRAIAFDKTGTLTTGRPNLVSVVPFETSERELLLSAIAVEKLSDHPLAAAVVKGGLERLKETSIPQASNIESLTGRGVKAIVNGQEVVIGKLDLFEKYLKISLPASLKNEIDMLMQKGQTIMIVMREKSFLGVLGLMDTPKTEAKETMTALSSLGFKRMIMLSGDNQMVAEAVAKSISLTDAWGNLLPEDKVNAIMKLKEEEKMVAMVGDGVNDAPAMAKSTVGIAMGVAGSDVALETADVALMSDNLKDLVFAIGLSRKSKKIIKQNLWMSLGVTALLIPATIFNFASIGVAVIVHEGSTLVIVANALRLLNYKKEK